MTESELALDTAKVHRRTVAASVKEACGIAATKAALWDLSEARVRDVKERRSGAVAANRPTDVRRINDELPDAEAEDKCAKAGAVASKLRYTKWVEALKDAKASINQAAVAVIDSEMLDLAAAFNDAFDAALKIGAQLQALSSRDHLRTPLNVPFPSVPVEVVRALERMPKPNPYDVPTSELRFGASSDAWARRFKELTADDELIDADDHTLRVEVGTHSRVAESLVISNGDATR
jgi:hypothetical protein